MPRRAASMPAGCRCARSRPASPGATTSLCARFDRRRARPAAARSRGQARIPLGVAGAAGSWTPRRPRRRLEAALRAARRDAAVGKARSPISTSSSRRIRGDVADRTIIGGVALDFAAVVADGAVVVDRFRARSGKGRARRPRPHRASPASARSSSTRPRTRFDPASYGAFPAGALDGRIVATGTLAPAWRVRADIALAAGKPPFRRWPLAGTARGTLRRASPSAMPRSIFPSARRGSRRRAAPARRTIASPSRSTRRIWPSSRPCSPPRRRASLSGALHAKATLARACRRRPASISRPAANGLKLPGGIAFGTLERARASVAPGNTPGRSASTSRRARCGSTCTATEFVTPAATFGTMRAGVAGTLAQHALTLAMKGEDLDLERVGPRRVRPAARVRATWPSR